LEDWSRKLPWNLLHCFNKDSSVAWCVS
jgi:hypothetical protein